MKLSPTSLLAVVALLPALGAGLQQQQDGSTNSGRLRTGQGGIVTGTGADRRPDDGDERGRPGETGIGNADAGNFDVFGRRAKSRANTLAERLMGGWRLVEMSLEGYDATGRTAQGFLHIGPGFLSLELHAAWNENAWSGSVPNYDVHTAFTADYWIEGGAKLHCQTIIGSFIDEETGALQWERPQFKREYTIREKGKQLILLFGRRGESASQLVFDPHLPALRGQTDIFGRRPLAPSSGEADIFGRERKSQTGERDIYGRIKPGTGADEGEGEGAEDEKGKDKPTGGQGAKRTGASYPLRGRSGNR